MMSSMEPLWFMIIFPCQNNSKLAKFFFEPLNLWFKTCVISVNSSSILATLVMSELAHHDYIVLTTLHENLLTC